MSSSTVPPAGPPASARRPPGDAWSVGAPASRIVLVAAVVLQLAVLYAPRAPSVATSVPHLDKLVHLAVFALVVGAARWAGVPRRRAVALLLAHAVVSELVQHLLLPGRSGDPRDVLADAGGVLVGALVALPGRRAAGGAGRGAGRGTAPQRDPA